MLKQSLIVAIAVAALPTIAEAQSSARAMITQGAPLIAHAPPEASAAPAAAMRDEYGNMYNSNGERIDRSGRILPPPLTPPGARALR